MFCTATACPVFYSTVVELGIYLQELILSGLISLVPVNIANSQSRYAHVCTPSDQIRMLIIDSTANRQSMANYQLNLPQRPAEHSNDLMMYQGSIAV